MNSQDLKVVSVKLGFEKEFWNIVDKDPLNYYFFIQDLKQQRDKTEILLAMNRQQVEGLMLVYDNSISQLRGTRLAVAKLLDNLKLEKVELQAPLDCEDLVSNLYVPHVKHDLSLMSMKKGEERIVITRQPERLDVDDADRVAEIMREADREWWGEATKETQAESLKSAVWLGIKEHGKLVSVGCTRIVDLASNIGIVATDANYRNKGFATSIVSMLVQEVFKKSPVAIIHVLTKNTPAVRAYSKVGFKLYRRYLLMRGAKKKQK